MKMEKQKIKAGKKNLKAKLGATLKTVDGQETPECRDVKCHIHGTLRTRGRIFEGIVKRKFNTRIMIELERTVYVKKYERYKKSKIRIHARLPPCMEKSINIGDLIRVQECRPLSKIIHFAVIEKLKDNEGEK